MLVKINKYSLQNIINKNIKSGSTSIDGGGDCSSSSKSTITTMPMNRSVSMNLIKIHLLKCRWLFYNFDIRSQSFGFGIFPQRIVYGNGYSIDFLQLLFLLILKLMGSSQKAITNMIASFASFALKKFYMRNACLLNALRNELNVILYNNISTMKKLSYHKLISCNLVFIEHMK